MRFEQPQTFMKTGFAIAAAFALLAVSLEANAETYFWTTEDGTYSFTDDVKKVPARYKAQAKTVDLKTAADKQITPHSTSGHAEALQARLESLRAQNAAPTANPNRLTDCTGSVTMTRERRQEGEYNRLYFIVTDECGRVVSETPFYPEVQINR